MPRSGRRATLRAEWSPARPFGSPIQTIETEAVPLNTTLWFGLAVALAALVLLYVALRRLRPEREASEGEARRAPEKPRGGSEMPNPVRETPGRAPEAPGRVPHAEPIDLNAVVGESEARLRGLLPAGVAWRTELDVGPTTVRADRSQLEQALAHLVANARDAMPGGGTLTVRTRTVQGAGTRMIEVEDTGQGMDTALLERAFEPFFTTRERALGLGLPTVQAIAYQSHGRVQVDSRPGRGTRVSIELPAFQPEQDALEAAHARGPETVLVVEDEEQVRAIVRRTLEPAGYTIIEAPDPPAALGILERQDTGIDLLLSDIMMPHMSGTELVWRVRERWPLVRVLFMSGYAGDPAVAQEVERDGAALVAKPFAAGELLKAVRRALDALPGPAEP